MYYLHCIQCDRKYNADDVRYTCDCGGLLEVKFERLSIDINELRKRRIGVWRYREFLPVDVEESIVSLQEGGTPLYYCFNFSDRLKSAVYVKNEGMNPTGSFKDRGMTVGVSKAKELGFNKLICASTGNTSASLAAYAAKAQLAAYVVVPSHAIALGKLAQALIYGAVVIAIEGNFDEALKIVRELSRRKRIYLLNSINPFRLEGQKTIAFEIIDELGHVPDNIIVPIGNAGNVSAIWKGMKEYKELGVIDKLPHMIGVQASGANPIAMMLNEGFTELHPIGNPETVASAIKIGNPVNWPKAVTAIRESEGFVLDVTDNEILYAQSQIANVEGIFIEPASAASIAGLFKIGSEKIGEEIVCVTTGTGLKDPDIVIETHKDKIQRVRTSREINNILDQ
jgi:threonine synthase